MYEFYIKLKNLVKHMKMGAYIITVLDTIYFWQWFYVNIAYMRLTNLYYVDVSNSKTKDMLLSIILTV
jgi:hypothetical protein